MIFFPAIDLKNGKVVRLKQGDYDQVTEYSDDPLKQAQAWAKDGATWLHMVDLDAAKTGQPVNHELIEKVAKHSGLKVQIGGGIRSIQMAQQYFASGVARVVVGTKAVQDPDFLKTLAEKFPNQVALGLDTKAGKIAVQGWTETTDLSIQNYLSQAPLQNVAALIFTDIARDGMLEGPNVEALRSVLEISPVPVIASGGVSSLEDLELLQQLEHPNLLGVISGKALYEGNFTVRDAIRRLG